MSGCSNCKSKPGCDDRKGTMFAALDRAIEQLYPSRRWGQPDDQVAFAAGISEGDGLALADDLAGELNASTFHRVGNDDELCDYIYVLCVGREPALVQIRDGEVPIPEELVDEQIAEQYLRVCLSSVAPFAGVQQVAFDLSWQGGVPMIAETPRPGVYDAPLLRRFQRLVAILPAYGLVHVDFGEICAPIEGFDPGDYAQLYGGQPVKANYLFYPQPPTMRTVLAVAPR